MPPDGAAPAQAVAFCQQLLQTLRQHDIPFLVGGGFALAHHTGISRQAKDLDLFIRRGDYEAIERLLGAAGHRVELTYPHWLAKVYAGPVFVDLIFNSGNGLAPVDDSWFAEAPRGRVLGQEVQLTAAEETLWTKAFIMERERHDGADVAHLLLACAPRLDWHRLLRRFGPHWRVLLGHLVFFGYIYPGQRDRAPRWLMDELLERLRAETHRPPPRTNLCAGTLLSREQYLHDIEELGYQDGRMTPLSTMSDSDVADWTAAIEPAPAAGMPTTQVRGPTLSS